MKHVVVFGGSFDPIHNGHLILAERAYQQRGADAVLFIPNQHSPFKTKNTSFLDRFNMIQFAIKDKPYFYVLDIEGKKKGPSYTADTIRSLKNIYKDVKFDFLIGSDQLEKLNQWRDFDYLSNSVEFIVYDRGDSKKHDYFVIQGPQLPISSSLIREGKSTQAPKEVLTYMMLKGLYLETMLKSNLSTSRFHHSLRVRDLAVEISNKQGLDSNKINLAAMWHDRYRESSFDRHLLPVKWRRKNKAFDHAYFAAQDLKNNYYVEDIDVLTAIKSHVDGFSTNPYSQVLYIADKCEPGRPYDTAPFIEESFVNLEGAYQMVKRSQEEYLRRKEIE